MNDRSREQHDGTDDRDVRHAVQAAGASIDPVFRSTLARRLRSELAGEEAPVVVSIPNRSRRTGEGARGPGARRWIGLGLVGMTAAAIAAVVVIRHEPGRPTSSGVPSVEPTSDALDAVEPVVSRPIAEPVTSAAPDSTSPTTSTSSFDDAAATSVASAVVAADSPKLPLVVDRSVDLPADVSVPDSAVTPTQVRFLPDGGVLVLDVARSTATVVEVDGSTRWSTSVPITVGDADAQGRLWAAAVGPDQIVYLSFRRTDSSGIDAFTLIAVPTNGPDAGTEVARWATDWQCVEGTCGEVTLDETGIVVGRPAPAGIAAYVDDTGAPSGATYPVSALEQLQGASDTPLPAELDAAGADPAFFGVGQAAVTLHDVQWQVEAVGVTFAEGAFTFFAEQPDGSVLAPITTVASPDAAVPSSPSLVRLTPDRGITQYELPPGSFTSFASIAGELYGIESLDVLAAGDPSNRIVHFTVDLGASSSSPVTTAEPTVTEGAVVDDTSVATTVAIATVPVVVAFPAPDGDVLSDTISINGPMPSRPLAVRDVGVLGQVLMAVTPDGSSAGAAGSLWLVSLSGMEAYDLGIEVSARSGVLVSAQDRLYVWDRPEAGSRLVWRVYEPTGPNAWTQVGEPLEIAVTGECTFPGCAAPGESAPLVGEDRIDWVRADDGLTSITSSVDGVVTTRPLDERDLDQAICFDGDCANQFATGPEGSIVAWQVVGQPDGTNRTGVTVTGPDGSSRSAWLEPSWQVIGMLGDELVTWPPDGVAGDLATFGLFDLSSLL